MTISPEATVCKASTSGALQAKLADGLAVEWKEERCDDAVFTIYLKKVRYGRRSSPCGRPMTNGHAEGTPPSTGSLLTAPDTQSLQWETVRERVIECGSLDRIVECLTTEHGDFDSRHFNVLFATYRAMATTNEVLRRIVNRYRHVESGDVVCASDTVRTNVLDSLRTVLIGWLETYPNDFYNPATSFDALTDILDLTKLFEEHLVDLNSRAHKLHRHFKRVNRHTAKHGVTHLQFASWPLHRLSGDRHGLMDAQMDWHSGHIAKESSLQVIYAPLDDPHLLLQLEHVSNGTIRPYGRQMLSPVSDITKIDPVYVAEQLTYWDATLFLQMLPWQCQTAFWGKRKKDELHAAAVRGVMSTVHQFNAVSQRVMTTILWHDPVLTPNSQRAGIVERWIEIASELRILKNFASFKAVVCALQCEPVHRLGHVWTLISPLHRNEFADLATTFTDDQQRESQMKIMEEESTSKSAKLSLARLQMGERKGSMPVTARRAKYQRAQSDFSQSSLTTAMTEVQGTVPYLGPFLTDLTMIDEAHATTKDNGMLNFAKRRLEFDVLAKLKLFQAAARCYKLTLDARFPEWFQKLPSLEENECFRLSMLIEPPASQGSPNTRTSASKPRKSALAKSSTWGRFFGSPSSHNGSTTDVGGGGGGSGRRVALEEHFYSIVGDSRNSPEIHRDRVNMRPMHQSTSHHNGMSLPRWPHGQPNIEQSDSDNSTTDHSFGQRYPSNGSDGENRRSRSAFGRPHRLVNFLRYGDGTMNGSNSTFYTGSEFDAVRLAASRGNTESPEPPPPSKTQSDGVTQSVSMHIGDVVDSSYSSMRMTNTPSRAASNGHSLRSTSSNMSPMATSTPLKEAEKGHKKAQPSNASVGKTSTTNSVQSSGSGSVSLNTTPSSTQNNGEQIYVLRVGLGNALTIGNGGRANYKCIRLENGDKIGALIGKALEKHLLSHDNSLLCLVQLLPNGREFVLPDKCNPYYAVVPPTNGQMLNFVLRTKEESVASAAGQSAGRERRTSSAAVGRSIFTSAASRLLKRNRNQHQSSSNLTQHATMTRWSSTGYL